MLDEQQSAQIVVDCIRAVSHVPKVDLAGTLDGAGIIDAPGVNNVVTLIVNSKNIGVPSKQHRINAGFFQNVETGTAVFEVIDIVRDNSTPVHDDPMEDFASLVAKHLADRLAPSAKSKTKKSSKKSKGKANK